MSVAGIKFLYIPCLDLASMRAFYAEILELTETYFSADEGMAAFDCDGLQLTFFQSEAAPPAERRFAWQPGWQGGTAPTISWSMPYEKASFDRVVGRLSAAGVTAKQKEPAWVGYWSFPVLDPMGNTVEVVSP